jgi:hypothetical protein
MSDLQNPSTNSPEQQSVTHSASNRRRFLRFPPSDQGIIFIQFPGTSLEGREYPALIIDESRVSILCSVVLPDWTEDLTTLTWKESDGILTECPIVRITPLANKVYLIAFTFAE